MIRIRDIAEICGVSTATVSNVIHKKYNKVSPALREKIEYELSKNGYVPNQSALMLAQTRTDIIGVVAGDRKKDAFNLEDPYFSKMFRYLEQNISSCGKYMMMLIDKPYEEVLRQAARWNFDGMILLNLGQKQLHGITGSYTKPIVTIDSPFEYDCSTISQLRTDDYGGGYRMGEYFAELGHTDVAMLADNDVSVDHFRWQGFVDGLREHHVVIDEKAHIIIDKTDHSESDESEEYERHFEKLRAKSAVFCASDYYARSLTHFMIDKGLRVPEDISIAGFDDLLFAKLCCPKLTTIHQDIKLKAKIAVDHLNRLIDGEKVEGRVVVPVRLMERNSVILHKKN